MSTPESASWSNSSAVTDFAFSFEVSRFSLCARVSDRDDADCSSMNGQSRSAVLVVGDQLIDADVYEGRKKRRLYRVDLLTVEVSLPRNSERDRG